MRTLVSLLIASLAVTAGSARSDLRYRVEELKSKVVIKHADIDRRASEGDVAVGGDLVRTGWFGRATLAVDDAASRFVIYSSTLVKLGDERPAVLLILERGKLEALFDALTGRDDRLVVTPGAVLAVRGTRYGVEVDRSGEAVLAVFEGRVEVRPLRPELPPLVVEAGTLCRFGPQTPPRTAPAPQGMNERSWRRDGATHEMPGSTQAPGDRPTTAQPGMSPGGQQPHGHGKGGGG